MSSDHEFDCTMTPTPATHIHSADDGDAPRTHEGDPPVAASHGRGRATAIAIALIAVATTLIGVAYASAFRTGGAPRWASWALATCVPLALVGTMALGAARAGRLSTALVAAFGVVGAMLMVGFGLALALPSDLGAEEPLLLGLPRRAAIIVYGIGLLPVFILPAAYAWTFDAQTLRAEDLERVRAAGAARRVTASNP